MRKIMIALAAAASIGAMSLATSSKAEAWWGWWGPGAVVGAFVGGAVVGSAIATGPYYPPPYTTDRTLITDHAAVASGTATLGCARADYGLNVGNSLALNALRHRSAKSRRDSQVVVL